jgi:DNA-binding CsgD family transcriptional regulator
MIDLHSRAAAKIWVNRFGAMILSGGCVGDFGLEFVELQGPVLTRGRTVAAAAPHEHDAGPWFDPACSEKANHIFALVSQGLSNKESARRLNCTERTVKHHMTNIMQKLNVRNRVQAVLKFARPH